MPKNDMHTRKCGCVYFNVGPPVLCATHAAKAKLVEEKGLRKIVRERALALGHDLTFFKEYSSLPGKWVSHCHQCGHLVIVYDEVPTGPDQIAGRPITEQCKKSALVAGLKGTEHDEAA